MTPKTIRILSLLAITSALAVSAIYSSKLILKSKTGDQLSQSFAGATRPSSSPSSTPNPSWSPSPSPTPPSCPANITSVNYVQALANNTLDGEYTIVTTQAQIDIDAANGLDTSVLQAQLDAYRASYLTMTQYLEDQIVVRSGDLISADKTLQELLATGCSTGKCPTVTVNCVDKIPGGGGASCDQKTCQIYLSKASCTRNGYTNGQVISVTNSPWVPIATNGSQAIQECMATHELSHAGDDPATCPNCSSEFYAADKERTCLANYIADYCNPNPPIFTTADCAALRGRRDQMGCHQSYNDCICRHRSTSDQNKYLPGTCASCEATVIAAGCPAKTAKQMKDLYCTNRETRADPSPSPSASPNPSP